MNQSLFIEKLHKLKKINKFCNLLQIKQNQEIFLSTYFTSTYLYPDFGDVYWRENSIDLQIYISSSNVSFSPSHINIPIFPSGENYIRLYATLIEYFGGSLDLIIFDTTLHHNMIDLVSIGEYKFFNILFEIDHEVKNINFKFSQGNNLNSLIDIIRVIRYYNSFYKYLLLLSPQNDTIFGILNSIIGKLFIPLDLRFKRQFIGLSGNIGNKIIQGRARVLYREKLKISNYWYNNFDDGDIIIANNTNVSYMKYIFKCSAIVTENSNLLSHASLISRELNIPLVLGVSDIFLKIFDGDLIEINSELGEVNIIKRFWE